MISGKRKLSFNVYYSTGGLYVQVFGMYHVTVGSLGVVMELVPCDNLLYTYMFPTLLATDWHLIQ